MTVYIVATTPANPTDLALIARVAKSDAWTKALVGTFQRNGYSAYDCISIEVSRDVIRKPRPKKRIAPRKVAS